MRGMTALMGALGIVTFLSLLLGDAHLFMFLAVCTALAPIVGWRDMRLHARVCMQFMNSRGSGFEAQRKKVSTFNGSLWRLT